MAGALEYRIGTVERERVRDLLERHTAEGRLSLDEFGERIDEVLRARTAGDLDHALRELPPQPVSRSAAPWGGQRPGGGAVGLARRVPRMLPVAAVGLLVFGLLAMVGAFWPVWILLLVGRFALLGGHRHGRWDRGWEGAPSWRGTAPGHSRAGWFDQDDTSQTRWV